MQHLMFGGVVDIADTEHGYFTSFFGASGYKFGVDDRWTFCNGLLVSFVSVAVCYVVTQNDKPIDCTSSHALYKRLTSLIERGKVTPPNNVFRLR